ncbi:MAG: SMP-30/gluconolactonase/LRE family protein [Anaerolineales bacterium]|nr:SMP-30/gluconolactonase/LRE family protein [Anaerolineales bacterium]
MMEHSNGIGWSPDRRTTYFTDSPRKAIYAYGYEEESGEISKRRVWSISAEKPAGPTVFASTRMVASGAPAGIVCVSRDTHSRGSSCKRSAAGTTTHELDIRRRRLENNLNHFNLEWIGSS